MTAGTSPQQAARQLLKAVREGDLSGAREALGRGASPDSSDGGFPAVVLAATKQDKGFLETLAGAGAALNARNAQGDTALMTATAFGHEENIRFLLEKGADASLRNKAGKSAADIAEHLFDDNVTGIYSAALDGALRPEEARLLDKWQRLTILLKEAFARDSSVTLHKNVKVRRPLRLKGQTR